MLSEKISEIKKLSEISPVIVCGISKNMFQNSVVVDAKIPSKQLGIISTKDGLKYPDWYVELKNNKEFLIIDFIDSIPTEEQDKFYELIKYKEITNTALPKKTKIIVIAKDIKNVSETIKRLCMIY